MQNGPIIVLFDWAVSALQHLSLVEWMKRCAVWVTKASDPNADTGKVRRSANFAIDLFIVLKWAVVLLCLTKGVESAVWFWIIAYLTFFNLFSYFVHHAWGSAHLPSGTDQVRERRRFVSFLQAFFFSIMAFAYFFYVPYSRSIEWPASPNVVDAILLSVSNSFTLTYDGFQPCDQVGRTLLVSQVLNSFFFLTVLVANSIPSLRDQA